VGEGALDDGRGERTKKKPETWGARKPTGLGVAAAKAPELFAGLKERPDGEKEKRGGGREGQKRSYQKE